MHHVAPGSTLRLPFPVKEVGFSGFLPSLPDVAMTPPTSTPGPTTVSRTSACTKQAPRLSTNKTFTFWRRRTNTRKSRSRVFTTGDRRVQAEKRERLRAVYYDAIQVAQGKIQEFAAGLKDRFGKHSTGHYYNDLIHRAHKSRSTRKVNQWNAYQKLELARMKRQYSITLDVIFNLPCIFRGTGCRHQSHFCQQRNQ